MSVTKLKQGILIHKPCKRCEELKAIIEEYRKARDFWFEKYIVLNLKSKKKGDSK